MDPDSTPTDPTKTDLDSSPMDQTTMDQKKRIQQKQILIQWQQIQRSTFVISPAFKHCNANNSHIIISIIIIIICIDLKMIMEVCERSCWSCCSDDDCGKCRLQMLICLHSVLVEAFLYMVDAYVGM